MFTIPDAEVYQPKDGKPKLMDTINYKAPGLTLEWPPEWQALAGGPSSHHEG